MSGPARWRLIREDDHLSREQGRLDAWRCEGDGVDLCRAPATWVAEHEHEGVLRVVGQRCPDHVPMRALAHLSTLPVPAGPAGGESSTPPVVQPTADSRQPTAVETEPALADTQPSEKYASPPPPATTSIEPVVQDPDEDDR